MEEFRRLAFGDTLWHATLAILWGLVLAICYSANVASALLISANVALIFAVGLMIYAGRLTDDEIEQTNPWRRLRMHERLTRMPERRSARDYFELVMLKFARAGAAAAIVLSGAALLV